MGEKKITSIKPMWYFTWFMQQNPDTFIDGKDEPGYLVQYSDQTEEWVEEVEKENPFPDTNKCVPCLERSGLTLHITATTLIRMKSIDLTGRHILHILNDGKLLATVHVGSIKWEKDKKVVYEINSEDFDNDKT